MNNKNLNTFSKLMLFFSLTVAAVSAAKVADYKMSSGNVNEQIEKAVKAFQQDDESKKDLIAKYTETVDGLKKKSLFTPPVAKKSNPIKSVTSILGKETQVNGSDKWYKAGDKIGDATIIAIEATQIKVEWNGKESTLAPIAAKVEYSSNKKPETKPEPKRQKSAEIEEEKPSHVRETTPEPTQSTKEADPLSWIGVKLSDKLRSKILEKWNQASDEEKNKWKTQWESMPDDRKQQAVDSMEKNIDKI